MTKYEGMIGSERCDKVLEEILERTDDSHITNVITRVLHDFRRQCKLLQKLVVKHDRALLFLC